MHRRRSGRLLVAALVAASSLSLVMISTAAAAPGGLVYPLPADQPLPDDGDGVSTLGNPCPSGNPHPVGGGVAIKALDDPGFDLEVKSTAPSNNKWRGQANNNSVASALMGVFVICATGDYTYPHKIVTIQAKHAKRAKVSCPAGRKVVGGGVTTKGGNHRVEVGSTEPADGPDGNHKIDDAWSASASNDTSGPVEMKVTAVCAKRGTYVIVSGVNTDVPDNSLGSTYVLCPDGTLLTGGGVHIDEVDTSLELRTTRPLDGPDADSIANDKWFGTINNDGGGETHQMRVIAICKQV